MPRKERTRVSKQDRRDAFDQAMEREGWKRSTRAWPDRYYFRADPRTGEVEVSFAAVPLRNSRRNATEQRELLVLLAAAGFNCYEIGLDGSRIPILPNRNLEKEDVR